MQPSPACFALARHYEGCKLTAYQDSGGTWTIGWGHTGQDVRPGLVWTQQQADTALSRDLSNAARWVETLTPGITLNQSQFDALTDFVFNEGAGHFATSTLLKCLKTGAMQNAGAQLLVWDYERQNGKEVQDENLEARRKDELALFDPSYDAGDMD